MERLDGDTEMPAADKNSEQSRLIGSNMPTRISYMNLISNLSALIFVGIITYCCFAKKDSSVLFAFHPILMALGWTVLMTSAVNAITPGDFATEWMPIRLRSARHWVIQVVTGIVVLTGFLVILSNKIINGKGHFETLHAKFGLASLVFMFVTMMGGVGALYSLKLKQFLAPIYTKLLHASVGLLTVTLGTVTIILAFYSKWWDFGEVLRYTNLVLVLIIMLFTILRPTLKVYFRLMERLENGNIGN